MGRLGLFEAQKDFLSRLHYFAAQPRAPGSDVSAEVLPLGHGGRTARGALSETSHDSDARAQHRPHTSHLSSERAIARDG